MAMRMIMMMMITIMMTLIAPLRARTATIITRAERLIIGLIFKSYIIHELLFESKLMQCLKGPLKFL